MKEKPNLGAFFESVEKRNEPVSDFLEEVRSTNTCLVRYEEEGEVYDFNNIKSEVTKAFERLDKFQKSDHGEAYTHIIQDIELCERIFLDD